MTTDYPRQQLKFIISNYGYSVIDEPKRCEALLKDLCPQHKREVNLLMGALREGIAKELLKPNQLLPIENIFQLMMQKLDENLGVAQHYAQWAVESWAFALGIKFDSAATAPSPDKGKAGIGSPQGAPVNHAAVLQQIKQQQAQNRASQAMIDQFKGWQKIGLKGEKLAVDAPHWAAVIDEKTNLMWAVNLSKTSKFPNPEEEITWDEAQAWVQYVNRSGWCGYKGCGYKDWRLPTIDELKTLLIPTRHMSLVIREDVLMGKVWSSSSANNGGAWFVNFRSGFDDHGNKYDNHYVHIVRTML